MNQNRIAAGVPAGGEFSAHDRADGSIELIPVDECFHNNVNRIGVESDGATIYQCRHCRDIWNEPPG